MLFCGMFLIFFFKKKIFLEYHQCLTARIQIRPDVMLGLIWVVTDCKRPWQHESVTRKKEASIIKIMYISIYQV